MKILILMPLDEQHVYAATGIYKHLDPKYQQITFAMPMFMEYLVDTHISKNWTYATYDSIISSKSYCQAAEDTNGDLIIIGNVDKKYKFDAVFNFQEIDEALPYKDSFIEHLLNTKAVQLDPILFNPINSLYTAADSLLALKNCEATADFINHYMKTDPHINEIHSLYDLEAFKTYSYAIKKAVAADDKKKKAKLRADKNDHSAS